LKYANSTHALRALLRLGDGEEESKRGRITKFSTMIHTSREGLNYYYFVEVTGINGCRYVIQAHGEEAEAFQKETKREEKNCIHVNGGKLVLVTRADTYNSSVSSAGVV
jgi:glutamate/tyrosine decarboxylase-like PLP-dependent enzyme